MIGWVVLSVGLGVWLPWFVTPSVAGEAVGLGRVAPEIAGGPWINSPPLTIAELRGRVVFVEFWTYG